MNRNNQPPQMPANQQQVPDHRLDEMQKQMRQLELQNAQLRASMDHLRQAPNQGTQPPVNPIFKPEVEDAIKQVVNQRLGPIETQYRQQIGYLADQLDKTKYELNYSGEKFKPYHDKVEQVHAQAIAENRYISREDALRLVYFEETGKKNVEPAPQAPVNTQPKFDPFFGTVVDPQTGKPLTQDSSGFAPEEQVDQNGNQIMQPQMHNMQPPAQPQWQQQPQQFQQPQQTQIPPGGNQGPQTQHPFGNAYGQFQLPQQGMNAQQPPAYQQPTGRESLSLDSSDAALQAFENNFGDMPL